MAAQGTGQPNYPMAAPRRTAAGAREHANDAARLQRTGHDPATHHGASLFAVLLQNGTAAQQQRRNVKRHTSLCRNTWRHHAHHRGAPGRTRLPGRAKLFSLRSSTAQPTHPALSVAGGHIAAVLGILGVLAVATAHEALQAFPQAAGSALRKFINTLATSSTQPRYPPSWSLRPLAFCGFCRQSDSDSGDNDSQRRRAQVCRLQVG